MTDLANDQADAPGSAASAAASRRAWHQTAALLFGCLSTIVLSMPAAASAQGSGGRGGRFEVSGAVGWNGNSSLGTETATLTGNGVPSGSPVVLFNADSSIDGGTSFEGRLAWLLTRAIAIEGSGSYARSTVRTRIDADYEDADPIELTERLKQFTVEAGLLWHLHGLAVAKGRMVPFVTGGGGFLRQLHDGRTLANNGAAGYVGGGIKYGLRERGRGWAKAFGLRADVRLRLHARGFDLGDDRVRLQPHASGGVYLRF